MSSHSTDHLFLSVIPSLPSSSSNSLSNNDQPNTHLPGVCLFGDKGKRCFPSVCIAVSKPRTRYVVKSKTRTVGKDGTQEDKEDPPIKVNYVSTKIIKEHVDSIKSMLCSMEDGEISISAYDTAWVALVEDVNGTGSPQFPSSLEWISNNQLEDGSWGYKEIFSVHDRIISTLACVIALKSWNVHLEKYDKGCLNFLGAKGPGLDESLNLAWLDEHEAHVDFEINGMTSPCHGAQVVDDIHEQH